METMVAMVKRILTWPDGVPILECQRIRHKEHGLAQISWFYDSPTAYVNFDNHMYGSYGFDDLVEKFERVGSSAANARSAAVFQMLANMGYRTTYGTLWWGLDRFWRPLMGEMAGELEVRPYAERPTDSARATD